MATKWNVCVGVLALRSYIGCQLITVTSHS